MEGREGWKGRVKPGFVDLVLVGMEVKKGTKRR